MKEECIICKAPLVYLEKDEMMECVLCLLTSHYFPTQTLKTLINTELFVILLVDK